MEHYCNKKRYRARDQYSSYKNKKKNYNSKYSDERMYDSYNTSNDRSYSYRSKKNDYDSYDREQGHNNCYYVF